MPADVAGSDQEGAGDAGRLRSRLVSRRNVIDGAIALLLIVLSFVGVAGSDIHAAFAIGYWTWLPLVFGLAAFWLQWRPGMSGGRVSRAALLAAGHWSAVWAAVYIVNDFNLTDHFTDANVGLANGLIFALATFLAGVHSNWRLTVVGAALAGAVTAEAYLEEKLWVLLALAIGALIAMAVIGSFRRAMSAGA
jgi:hypothetical protein